MPEGANDLPLDARRRSGPAKSPDPSHRIATALLAAVPAGSAGGRRVGPPDLRQPHVSHTAAVPGTYLGICVFFFLLWDLSRDGASA